MPATPDGRMARLTHSLLTHCSRTDLVAEEGRVTQHPFPSKYTFLLLLLLLLTCSLTHTHTHTHPHTHPFSLAPLPHATRFTQDRDPSKDASTIRRGSATAAEKAPGDRAAAAHPVVDLGKMSEAQQMEYVLAESMRTASSEWEPTPAAGAEL